MAKSKITGFDDFLQSTTEVKSEPGRHEIRASKGRTEKELTLINFQVPVSLKKEISKYCIENDISIRDFLTNLIEEKLSQGL